MASRLRVRGVTNGNEELKFHAALVLCPFSLWKIWLASRKTFVILQVGSGEIHVSTLPKMPRLNQNRAHTSSHKLYSPEPLQSETKNPESVQISTVQVGPTSSPFYPFPVITFLNFYPAINHGSVEIRLSHYVL